MWLRIQGSCHLQLCVSVAQVTLVFALLTWDDRARLKFGIAKIVLAITVLCVVLGV